MAPDSDGPDSTDSEDSPPQKRNALEWTVFGFGVAIVAGVLGFLVYQLVAGSDEPADLRITMGPPDTVRGTVLVPVTVDNEGDRVAEEAVVEVCAADACGELTFTYVPQGSSREGVVGLEAPLGGPLRGRVVSYRTR